MIVAGNLNDTLPDPLTDVAVPVFVPSVIVIFLAVPHLAVVIFAVPSKLVPLIVLAVVSFEALVALATLPAIMLAFVVSIFESRFFIVWSIRTKF